MPIAEDRVLSIIKGDLLSLSPELFASKWVMENVPYIFNNDTENITSGNIY